MGREDLVFNLDEMNVKSENLDFLSGQEAQQQAQPGTEPSREEEEEEQGPVLEIDETKPVGDDKDTTTDNADNADDKSGEEKPDGEKASQEKAPSSDDSSQKSTLYALAQHLKEEGVLFIDEDIDDIKDLDQLKQVIEKSNEQARYAKMNESQRRYYDALENGIPKNEFEESEKRIQTFSQIKEEDVVNNENLRYEILAIDMINQGMDREKAMKIAKFSLADENNVTDAKQALQDIIAHEKTKFEKLVEQSKTTYQATIDDYKKSIFEKETLLDSKLNDVTKNKLFEQITTRVDTDEQGRPLNELQKWQKENPVESSIMMNYLFMMTNKGKDLKLIKQSSTTQASKDLEKRLRENVSFDQSGSLIIPENMVSGGSRKKQAGGGEIPNIAI